MKSIDGPSALAPRGGTEGVIDPLRQAERALIMAEKGKRGFAAMDREKQRRIASMGGKAAHRKGTAHEFTPEEAREAGRKGGQAAHESGKAHVFTSEEAREAGRKGGQSSHARRSAASNGMPADPQVSSEPEQTYPAAESAIEAEESDESDSPATVERYLAVPTITDRPIPASSSLA